MTMWSNVPAAWAAINLACTCANPDRCSCCTKLETNALYCSCCSLLSISVLAFFFVVNVLDGIPRVGQWHVGLIEKHNEVNCCPERLRDMGHAPLFAVA